MRLGVTLDILNQKGTPAFFADTLANRPAAGFTGRVFISTDTLDLYRDTGTTWVLLSPSSTGTITGSGAAGQVTYFSAASSITGDNNLFWDSVNGHLGIKTITPDCALDVNHAGTFVAKFNNTTTANTLIGIYNLDNPQWLIGSNSVANDLTFYDATNFPTLLATTTMKTNGTTFIGGQTTGSGRLNVYSATGDNGIQISGPTAPSLRIDNAPTGATKRIGLGISTATNNFIQGSADRDMCIFNGSTTASPMLFGIYDTTNVQEAARISVARNFLVGTTTDAGQKLQVNGAGYIVGNLGVGTSDTSTYRVNVNNTMNVNGNTFLASGGGGVVIGDTTAPIGTLDIKATSPVQYFQAKAAVTSGSRGDIGFLNSLGNGTATIRALASSSDVQATTLQFLTRDTTGSQVERLVILNNGNVGIQRTTAEFPLDVNGDIALPRTSKLQFTGGTAGDRQRAYFMGNGNNDIGVYTPANNIIAMFHNSGNTLLGQTTNSGERLQVSGNTKITSTTSNQLTLDGGTTVQSRILLARGSDDSAQGMTIGYTNITSYRTSTPLSQPQTDFSLKQTGSDGTRTNLYMDDSGNIQIVKSLSIGNSVAAGVGVASTHKVSILIGGVQYYLLASNV